MSDNKEVAVSVNDIHKEFILPQHKNTTFKQTVVNIVKKNNTVTQKVLDGVSFKVNKGDFFGIVGRNGSGKSTLLKLIAGVYYPTDGSVDVNGGLTPFIELGVGFNPELSGRDNVFLNGALLGYNRTQMAEMYDDIVAFAELEQFMDQKLKNYSSGMQVRLAFSIAIKAKNDILIFDEVLAVGDEAFQRKCLDVFEKYKAEGQTVILVTHDMETVRQFCSRAILISEGKLLIDGNPQQVADEYSRLNQEQIDEESRAAVVEDIRDVSLAAELLNLDESPRQSFNISDQVILNIKWGVGQGVKSVMYDLFKQSGEHVSGFNTAREGLSIDAERHQLSVKIKASLSPGKYYFMIATRDDDERELETLYRAVEFTIKPEWPKDQPTWAGLMPIEHSWL